MAKKVFSTVLTTYNHGTQTGFRVGTAWYEINERVFSQSFFVSEAEAYLVPNAHEKGRDFMPYFQAIPRSDLFVDVNTSFSCHYSIIPSKR